MKSRASRLNDRARRSDGKLGPAVQASSNVLIECRRALRGRDAGIYDNDDWTCRAGAKRVLINRRPAQRQLDHTDPHGVLIESCSHVLIGDYDHHERQIPAKIRLRIVHQGGVPASYEAYTLLDEQGAAVVCGTLDSNGRLELDNVPWLARQLKLNNGWTVRLR